MRGMARMTLKYFFPENPSDFEVLMLRLFQRHWNAPQLRRFGRRGQKQLGGDILGPDEAGRMCFIQCKHRDIGKKLRLAEVEKEVVSAWGMTPPVDRFAVATTAPRDARLQQHVVKLSLAQRKRGLFSVEIYCWDDINELLNEYPEVPEGVLSFADKTAMANPSLPGRPNEGATASRFSAIAEIAFRTWQGFVREFGEGVSSAAHPATEIAPWLLKFLNYCSRGATGSKESGVVFARLSSTPEAEGPTSWLLRSRGNPIIAVDRGRLLRATATTPVPARIQRVILHEIGHIVLHWEALTEKLSGDEVTHEGDRDADKEATWFGNFVTALARG